MKISVVHKKSTEALPEIMDSQKKSILWLDYDGSFEKYMLEDIAIFTRNAVSGNVLSLSFNIDSIIKGKIEGDESSYLEEKLKEIVDEKYVPQNPDARGWRTSKKLAVFLKDCIKRKIQEILSARNIGAAPEIKLGFDQILFFTYADGADMATVSFVFFEEKDRLLYEQCKFNDFYFFSPGDDPFDIKTPNLTMKEIRHIMEVMPDTSKLDMLVFVDSDVKALWQNYRYFPNFTEVEGF